MFHAVVSAASRRGRCTESTDTTYPPGFGSEGSDTLVVNLLVCRVASQYLLSMGLGYLEEGLGSEIAFQFDQLLGGVVRPVYRTPRLLFVLPFAFDECD